jgi:C-terminal processing protease CtpA/Prc
MRYKLLGVIVFALVPFVMLDKANAFNLDGLGKAQDVISKGQDAVGAGREGLEKGRQIWEKRNNPLLSDSIVRTAPPSGPAVLTRDEGGANRLSVLLGNSLSNRATDGQSVVGLLDRGAYFVQRQSAASAPKQGQVLLNPRSEATVVTLDLPGTPVGKVFDFASGRSSPSGRGVRIYTLSVYGDVPLRVGRNGLDAIEQHTLLHASSVQMEWPRSPEEILEPVGGKLLVHASDAGVSFPSGFGLDGKLFTADDPIVSLPQGYTVVTLEAKGFAFDRGREVAMSFHPVIPNTDIDLTRLSHGDAFQAFSSLMSERYPYRDVRSVDWVQTYKDLEAAAIQAGSNKDTAAYVRLFTEVGIRLRDSQYQVNTPSVIDNRGSLGLSVDRQSRGGFSLAVPRMWLSKEGKLWVTGIAAGSPAAQAGLKSGAEILEIDGEKLGRVIERLSRLSSRATDTGRRLDGLVRHLMHADSVRLLVRQDGREQSLELRRLNDGSPISDSQLPRDGLGAFQLRSGKGNDFGYLGINSFTDAGGKLMMWEQALAVLTRARITGLVVDLRGNSGGSYQLVPHLIASFFSYDRPLLPKAYAQRQLDSVSKVWRTRGGLGLPPDLPLFAQDDVRYAGKLVLLVDQECRGPCEIFTSWLQRARRAFVVGTEATAAGVGHLTRVHLPSGVSVEIPMVSELMASGDSYVDGVGVQPDLRVTVDADFIQRINQGGDPVLDAAVLWLDADKNTR